MAIVTATAAARLVGNREGPEPGLGKPIYVYYLDMASSLNNKSTMLPSAKGWGIIVTRLQILAAPYVSFVNTQLCYRRNGGTCRFHCPSKSCEDEGLLFLAMLRLYLCCQAICYHQGEQLILKVSPAMAYCFPATNL